MEPITSRRSSAWKGGGCLNFFRVVEQIHILQNFSLPQPLVGGKTPGDRIYSFVVSAVPAFSGEKGCRGAPAAG